MSGLAEILEQNDLLRAQLREMEAAHAEAVALYEAKVAALQRRAEELAQALEFIRLKAAAPRTERFVPSEQEPLPLGGDLPRPPPRLVREEEPKDEAPAAKKGAPKRRRLADDTTMPRRQVRCAAPDEAHCARCGGPLRVFGQTTSHRVDWVPGHFVIDEIVRDKCACPNCPGEGVLTAAEPYALPRAMCGNGLLARVLVDKFADHLPLNRQAQRMEREGFEVATSTLCGWVADGAGLLGIVARAVRDELLTAKVLQGDDTGLPVQDGTDGAVRKGRLWAFTDQEQVFYAFSVSKHGKHPSALLKDFKGRVLLADGGSEFNEAVQTRGLERAGCWSHLRRYFFDARLHHPTEARVALEVIRDLFLLERQHRERSPEERLAARREQSLPLVDGFFAWVQQLSTFVRPKSTLADAVTYARNQEEPMRAFLDHPELPLHNNLSELMLRQPIVGRKNWLFAGSEGGAQAACTVFTLVGSCMLQGIDPQQYLVDVLGRLPDWPANRVTELTPKAWRMARDEHRGS